MNPEKTRKQFFEDLDDYLSVSHKKFMTENLRAKERRAWARIGITAIQAYGKLLEPTELQKLAQEVAEIKAELKRLKNGSYRVKPAQA